MKKRLNSFYLGILCILSNNQLFGSNHYLDLDDQRIRYRKVKLISNEKNEIYSKYFEEVNPQIHPALEQYLLFCSANRLNCDLNILESKLLPLAYRPEDKQRFKTRAYCNFSVPLNFIDNLYDYFRSRALEEQQETKLQNTDAISELEKINSPELLTNRQQHNQDDASDDESFEEVKTVVAESSSTPPVNEDFVNIQAPRILSKAEFLAKEEELRKDIIKTRDVDKAHEYFIFFYTNENQLEERKDKAKYVFTAIDANLGMMNHIQPQFTAKKYTDILKMYYTYYSHNGKIETQIKNKHAQKGFIKLIIKHCDEDGKQLGKQFNFIKK